MWKLTKEVTKVGSGMVCVGKGCHRAASTRKLLTVEGQRSRVGKALELKASV